MDNDIETWRKRCGKSLSLASRLLWKILANEELGNALIIEENAPDMILAEEIVDKYGWGFIPSLVDPKIGETYLGEYTGEIVGIIGKKVQAKSDMLKLLGKRQKHTWDTLEIMNVKEHEKRLGVCDTYGTIGFTVYSNKQLFFHISFHEVDYSIVIKVGQLFPLEKYSNDLMELIKEYSKFANIVTLTIIHEKSKLALEKATDLSASNKKENTVKICLNCQTRWRSGDTCPKCRKNKFLTEVGISKKGIIWRINE